MASRGGRAGRYAVALFSIASERGTTDAWLLELQRLGAVAAEPGAMRVLTSPGVALREKQSALDSVAGPLSKEVSTLVLMLLERKRINQLPALAEAFADLVRKSRGIELADVTTAIDLSEADRQAIDRSLATYLGRPVDVRYHVDQEIIGGVVARVGDQLIDGSVRGRLDQLSKTLHSV